MVSQRFGKLISILTISILLVSACGGTEASPTPTEISLEAIYTAAAATIFAGQTGTAAAQPSKTLTPTSTVTPTPTMTTTPAPTRAVFVPILPISTAVSTMTGTPGTLVPSITPTFGAVGCNNSVFIQDVTVPNNTKLTAGETFTKTWRIKNTGTCAWTAGYKFTFIGGELFGSDTRKIRTAVSIGGTLDLSLSMVAPTTPGTYSSYWRMANETGQLFGTSFSTVIIIPGATYTPTSAVSPTPTSAAGATQTAAAATSAAAGATQTAIAATQAAGTQAAAAATQAAAAATQAADAATQAAAAATQAAAAAQTQAADAATQAAAASQTAAAPPPAGP